MTTLNIICDVDENESKEPEKEEKMEEEPKEIVIEKEDNNIIEELKVEDKKEEEPKEIVIEKEDNNIIEESKEEEKKEEEPKEKEIQIVEIKEEKHNIEKEDSPEKYFVIIYSREEKENQNDMTFTDDCKNKPKVILTKGIKIHDNKYTYKKVLKFKNTEHKKKAEFSFYLGKGDYKYFF